MKKALLIILSVVLISALLIIPISASAGDEYTDFFLERDEAELATLPPLTVNEYGSGIIKDTTVEEPNTEDKYFIKGYLFQTNNYPELLDIYDNNGNFASLVSNDYIYRYVNPDFDLVVNLIYNEDSEKWSKGQSGEIKHMKNIAPELDISMKGMIDHIAIDHPDFDFESVKYVYDYGLATDFLYFTENEQEYVTVYYKAENRFDFPNGSIFSADALIDILREDDIFQPLDNLAPEDLGALGPGTVSNDTSEPSVWLAVTIISVAAVALAVVLTVMIVRKRKTFSQE